MMNLSAFSQQIISNKDTLVCFTIPQAKFLLKKYYDAEKFKALDSVSEKQSSIKDSVIKSMNVRLLEKDSIIADDSSYILIQNKNIKSLNISLYKQQVATEKQIVYKWAAIVIGGLISAFEGYMAFIKP